MALSKTQYAKLRGDLAKHAYMGASEDWIQAVEALLDASALLIAMGWVGPKEELPDLFQFLCDKLVDQVLEYRAHATKIEGDTLTPDKPS